MSIQDRPSAGMYLLGAGIFGAIVGVGSVVTTPEGRGALARAGATASVVTGLKRAREPQSGDAWGGCNDARAAGTAPIYRGEPGYRDTMDGDGDGVACEMH